MKSGFTACPLLHGHILSHLPRKPKPTVQCSIQSACCKNASIFFSSTCRQVFRQRFPRIPHTRPRGILLLPIKIAHVVQNVCTTAGRLTENAHAIPTVQNKITITLQILATLKSTVTLKIAPTLHFRCSPKEIPSNRRSAVLEYINNYNCKGIDDGNFNAYVYIYNDDETDKDTINAYSRALVWETMDIDEFSAFTLSTLWALKAVMRGIFRLTL